MNIKHNRRDFIDHAAATLEDGSVVSTPFWRVDSGRDGPSLLLMAAQHGNSVQGAEVARRFKNICANQLVAGSAWLLHMTNLLAVRKRRYSISLGPKEPISFSLNHNMERTWPG